MITLYEQLGEKNLTKLITEFYNRVFTSEKIGPLFQTDQKEIMDKQYKFLSQFLGGPQLYSIEFGHPRMKARHLSHKITSEAKEEWLRCMKLSIETLEIEAELKNELYACFPKVAEHMVNQ